MKNLIFIIIVLLSLILTITKNNRTEQFIQIKQTSNPTWSQNTCKFNIQETLQKVLDSHNIKKSTTQKSTLFMPCTYDDTNSEISAMPDTATHYFIIDNVDEMVAKNKLWEHILSFYGIKKALDIMPMTYVLTGNDRSKIQREFNKDKIYIMKNNNQRQEGLKITNSLDEILSTREYVLVQELLQDPYLISGRKINMRFYVLIVCNHEEINVFVYNNGFMYYTKDLFKPDSLEFGPNITTGYIDRQVYIDNPLTHEDFRRYLGFKHTIVFNRIYNLLQEVYEPYMNKICNGKLKNKISFQLFGVDIALSNKLEPKIMEINKGPDMDSKDERDGKVKTGCITDTLKILGLIDNVPTSANGFIHILEYKK